MAQRRKYPASMKSSIVLANLRGEATVSELARRHGIHETMIQRWKQQFLEAGEQGLAGKNDNQHKSLKDENERLKKLLGEKELELDIAKKIRGL